MQIDEESLRLISWVAIGLLCAYVLASCVDIVVDRPQGTTWETIWTHPEDRV